MLLRLRLLFVFLHVVHAILLRILSFIHRRKPPSIPPIRDSLYTLSATTLAKKIRQGEITSEKVVRAYIERIKEVNPYVKAVIDDRFESAITEAKICDEQLKAGEIDVETLEKEKPFFGVPLTVKEACSVKGLSSTGCTFAFKGRKAPVDSVVVESLRNAGAIPLCVTNTPELCYSMDTINRLFGRTCNPYDTRYSPGGSSGGEGAIIGAGASLIGIGSDLGGSIRIPSSFSGIFGHKPTPGIIPIKGHFPTSEDKILNKYLTLGPMTRYAEDLSLIMRIMTSKCDYNLRLDEPVDLKQLKVYYMKGVHKSLGVLPVLPEVEQCVMKVAEHFSQNGIHAEKLPIKWPSTMLEITITSYFLIKDAQVLIDPKDPKKRQNPIIELGKGLIGRSKHMLFPVILAMLAETHFPFTKADISRYTKQGEDLRQKLIDLLGEDGIFVYPFFRTPATFPLLMPIEFGNNLIHTSFVNIFGLPSVNVPIGLNRDGLPLSVQVIAGPYQDRLCLAVAKDLEKAFGGWVPPSIRV